ncbi:MAG: hypothetical protein PVH00_10390 [Gemmatimonadota bacterium]|jgi:hypothetical protein
MRTTTKVIVAAAVVAGLGAAGPARADQLPATYAGPGSERATTQAEKLESQALDLFSQPDQYCKAAKLLQRAAKERALGDPVRIRDLHLASRLSYYGGREGKALDLMQQSAAESLATGDVIAAANRYVDAAFLAKSTGDAGLALEMVKKATLLAGSPLIDVAARTSILTRVEADT